MLDGTKRNAVPIRRAFVQVPPVKGADPAATRGAVLAKLVKIRQPAYLDAFLLIHAMASASEPYTAQYPAITWAHALGFDEHVGAGVGADNLGARAKWSKIVQKLKAEHLITSKRSGNEMTYHLLNESGDDTAYTRPKTAEDGKWLSIPDIYWRGDFYMTLSLPAKAMLLIALHEKDDFPLPIDRVPRWYGISASTAQRGFAELTKEGILSHRSVWRIDPKSPTGYTEERRYSLVGPWRAKKGAKPTGGPKFGKSAKGKPKPKKQSIDELIAGLNQAGTKSKASASSKSGKAPRKPA